MEIELITTKKKLTKSIVNQMPLTHSLDIIRDGKSIGFLLNIRKDCSKALLIQYINLYYILPGNYINNKTSISRIVKRKEMAVKISSMKELDAWWGCYQKRLKEARTQIYI